MMIRVEGLTARQTELIQELWAMEDVDEIMTFMHGLDTDDMQQALAVMNLLMAEYIDTLDLGDCAEARTELARMGLMRQ